VLDIFIAQILEEMQYPGRLTLRVAISNPPEGALTIYAIKIGV
jgi:hypothetical protein